ncbi:MAG: hypothetical protein BGO12_23875 [Verrucomicrobia bacterium 61-8]|nr:DUF3185 domain-containing protein [Verrucomicrobiota bacterium]OJV02943.1 MAG: hypothetical protein BGO12_23875 [Verrucomicrobia bacterium 61-8]
MRAFGIVMIVVGVLSFITPLVLSTVNHDKQRKLDPLEIRAENGESMSLFPLLGVVAVAAGGAMIFAQVITKKR